VIDDKNTVMPGFYAAGEVACVSVHGANRLGTNALLDLIVFGKHSGLKAAEYAKGSSFGSLPADATDFAREQFAEFNRENGTEKVVDIAREMKEVMFEHVGVFRVEDGMQQALDKVRELKERFKHISIDDHGKKFNTDVFNAWELANLLDTQRKPRRPFSG